MEPKAPHDPLKKFANGQDSKKPVRALVLSGGGGRGAYEVGVIKACRERDFDFDIIVGTSTGALNAALYAQDDIDLLESIWKNISAQDIYKLPAAGHLRRLIFGQRLGFFDTTPLEELLQKHVDLDKFKNSRAHVGLVTTDLCSLETRVITAGDIDSKEDLVDALMASSALPILFPPRQFKGEGCWIDGGLVRNTPIQTAIKMGAKEIFAVLVEPMMDEVCPTSLFKLVSRLMEILFDHSARSGIAHVNQHNRLTDEGIARLQDYARDNWCLLSEKERLLKFDEPDIEDANSRLSLSGMSNDRNNSGAVSGESDSWRNDSSAVTLYVIKPRRNISGALLELDPSISQWLIKQGYDDVINQCIQVSHP